MALELKCLWPTLTIVLIFARMSLASPEVVIPIQVTVSGSHGKIGAYCEQIAKIRDDKTLLLGLLSDLPYSLDFEHNLLKDGLRVKDIYFGTISRKYRSILNVEPFDLEDTGAIRDAKILALVNAILSISWSLEETNSLHRTISAILQERFPDAKVECRGRTMQPNLTTITADLNAWAVKMNDVIVPIEFLLRPSLETDFPSRVEIPVRDSEVVIAFNGTKLVAAGFFDSRNDVETWLKQKMGNTLVTELRKLDNR